MSRDEFRSFDFDVEELFDEFVVSVGGKLIKEIVDDSPTFQNADYLFRQEKVILELKTLENDHLAGGGLLDRFHKALGKANDIVIDEPGYYPDLALPTPSAFRGVTEEPLRRTLKKANRQLKETAAHFEMEDAQKVILVNNDGLLSLGPEETVATLASILSREFSSTDGFVYFTTNIWIRGAEDEPVQLWAPNCAEHTDPSLIDFLKRLGYQWFDFLGDKIGGWDRPPREIPPDGWRGETGDDE